MFTYLYDWMYQITFYLVIFTAALQLLPSGNYRKYVRFFVGLVLILLVISPVLKLSGTGDLSQMLSEKEQEVTDFEETLYLKNVELGKEANHEIQNKIGSNDTETQGVTGHDQSTKTGTESGESAADATEMQEKTTGEVTEGAGTGGQRQENGQKQIFVEPVRLE